MKKNATLLIPMVFVWLLVSSCAPNKPWRTTMEPQDCQNMPDACATAIWEDHPQYDLAFIEFSERGNAFSNEYLRAVYDRLWVLNREPEPLAIIVFVHGWKHNASNEDSNVISFRRALENLSKSNVLGSRQLIGVYIGWRGKSLHGLQLENLTYWDRKAVAQEVGKGGVTDVFIELEKIDRSNDKNYFFIMGHSFGGAITLSALNEIFLARLKNADGHEDKSLNAFGEGTVIINPAIEANQILQLKEASMALGCATADQPNLLHVVSSMGDTATHKVFPIGQALGVGLTWNQQDLRRTYKKREYIISEYDLDTTAVGNYPLFHTAALLDLDAADSSESEALLKQFKVAMDRDSAPLGQWLMHSYCNPSNALNDNRGNHLPCEDNEAISFVYTTQSFIQDHNDVFNDNVMAYFSTLVSEAIFKRPPNLHFPQCAKNGKFLFGSCFNYHWKRYQELNDQ